MSMLTTAEAAARLRQSPITTMRQCARGVIPATKCGRQWLISEATVEALLAPDNIPAEKPEFLTASQKRQARRSA